MPSVIIPSATIVPEELRKIGKLPAIIFPVNQKIVFEYLYKQYQAAETVNIICHEKADKVERRLTAYSCDNVHIRKLPQLGDLGNTIQYGLQFVQGEVIVNFADTIVTDNIVDIEGDCFFATEDYVSEKWTYFDEKNGIIEEIYDKNMTSAEIKKLFFVGVFKFTDASYLGKCIETALLCTNRNMNSFYYALMLYSRRYPMRSVETTHWFDIGHSDTYYNTQLEVKAREFNHIEIDRNRGILKKYSEDKEKFIGEILWYVKMPADVEYVRPRIFSYSTAYEKPYVEMEYYAYHTIHEFFLYGDLERKQWESIFNRIRFACNDFRRYKVVGEQILPSVEDMYLKKTEQRIEKISEIDDFEKFFSQSFFVNGVKYKSLNEIVEIMKEKIPEYLYDVSEFNIIHGDLCFANILIDSNFSFVKLIDPRGRFGTYDIYGDFRYELAKLFHSVDGKYDFIIKDLFNLDYDTESAKIEFAILDRKRDFDLYQVFLEAFSSEIGDDIKKIELIEALLFLSMIPLHGESRRHQMVMFGMGIEILNRVFDIKA